MSSWSSWADWAAESAASLAQTAVTVAAETVQEIIAEGKEELSGEAQKKLAQLQLEQQLASRALWDPLQPPPVASNDDEAAAAAAASSAPPTASSSGPSDFWIQNPMQWACLVHGISHDINTFTIPISVVVAASATEAEFTPPSNEAIRKMLKESEALATIRYDLVPRWVTEDDFWANFAWRCRALARTASVDDAVKLLWELNTEKREIPAARKAPAVAAAAAVEKTNGEDDDKNSKQQQEQQVDDASPKGKDRILSVLDELLLTSPKHKAVPFAGVLRRRGYGTAQPDAVLLDELAERIHATAEKESWINNFTARAGKQLGSVRSSVAMLTKLISEVEEIVNAAASSPQREQQDDDGDDDDDDKKKKSLPSLELLQSVAESCKYHKGRVAALIGELEMSPAERVAGSPALDPDNGSLSQELKAANQKLAEVLVQQDKTLKLLGQAVTQQRAEAAAAAASPEGSQEAAVAGGSGSPASSSAAFVAVMPWDDVEGDEGDEDFDNVDSEDSP